MAFFGLVLCRITGGCLNFALSGSVTKDLQVAREPHLCYVPQNLLEWHVVLSCCYSRLCIIQTTCRPDAERLCIQTVKCSHICVTDWWKFGMISRLHYWTQAHYYYYFFFVLTRPNIEQIKSHTLCWTWENSNIVIVASNICKEFIYSWAFSYSMIVMGHLLSSLRAWFTKGLCV